MVLLAFSLGIEITIVNKYNSLFNHIQGCYNLQRHAFREGSVSHRTLILFLQIAAQQPGLLQVGFITFTHSVTVQTFTLQCPVAITSTFISH